MDDIFAALDQFDHLPEVADGDDEGGEGTPGRLTTPEGVARFVKAGRAIITLESQKTGNRFTYKITKPKENRGPAALFVGVLSGPDNQHHYRYAGMIRNDPSGERFTLTRNSKITRDAPSYKAFEYFWRAVVAQKRPESSWGMNVWHEGVCGRCSRPLTVPLSVETGFGPRCRKVMGLE